MKTFELDRAADLILSADEMRTLAARLRVGSRKGERLYKELSMYVPGGDLAAWAEEHLADDERVRLRLSAQTARLLAAACKNYYYRESTSPKLAALRARLERFAGSLRDRSYSDGEERTSATAELLEP